MTLFRKHNKRFEPFPRSICVPPADFRSKVTNWADFIEYLPQPRPWLDWAMQDPQSVGVRSGQQQMEVV